MAKLILALMVFLPAIAIAGGLSLAGVVITLKSRKNS